MTLGVYLSFIGGKASLPDPAVLPTTGDVLRYLSYCASPTLSGTSLLHHVAQTLIDTYCCSDKQKALVKTPPAKKGRYNLTDLTELTPRLAAEQLSNRSAARLLTKYNQVVGIDDNVTEKKIRGIRGQSREEVLKELSGLHVESLYFDGRKDKGTLVNIDGTVRWREEEHVTLVDQPSGLYLGFATPHSGSGADMLEAILTHCEELKIDLSELKSCGCDGTSTNTGRHAGVVALLERRLGRQLQRSICCLHRIELPFRHYFTSLDGVTTGPNSFSGPIGTLAAGNLHLLPPRKFAPIQSPDFSALPDEVVKKLSWDQKVLYRHVVAVQKGNLTPKLANTEIGPVCQSRWITFQSRILRLYMSNGVARNILPKLRKLALYVLNIYFPLHMNIKYESSIVHGCVNLFKEVSLIKKYVKSKVEQEYILSSLQVNSYFAHPHNVLISMLGDECYVIRKEAIDIIVDIRNLDYGEQSLDYYLPKVNFDAVSYSKLCSMSKMGERWVYLTFMDKQLNM
ncbi:hypothetical protein ACHWQZ_G000503 [Mnemiopsis leidyi]